MSDKALKESAERGLRVKDSAERLHPAPDPCAQQGHCAWFAETLVWLEGKEGKGKMRTRKVVDQFAYATCTRTDRQVLWRRSLCGVGCIVLCASSISAHRNPRSVRQ